MKVGEVSQPVETPFGIHIIKVEDRKMQSFDELKGQFRDQMKEKLVQDAEQAYVKALTDTMNIEDQPGAYEAVKDLSQKSSLDLSGLATP